MGEIFEDSRLRHENEKLREMNDAMAKALAKRETLNTRPTWEVSADPLLVAENARLREALRECVEFMEADCREECEWPCPDSVACGRKKIFLKAREVLGDE